MTRFDVKGWIFYAVLGVSLGVIVYFAVHRPNQRVTAMTNVANRAILNQQKAEDAIKDLWGHLYKLLDSIEENGLILNAHQTVINKVKTDTAADIEALTARTIRLENLIKSDEDEPEIYYDEGYIQDGPPGGK